MGVKVLLRRSIALLIFSYAASLAAAATLSDAEVKKLIIQESIAAYSGACPCPYNVMRNGSSCGRRSAHSRPGGAAPLCYPGDVSQEMVESYRARNGIGK